MTFDLLHSLRIYSSNIFYLKLSCTAFCENVIKKIRNSWKGASNRKIFVSGQMDL